MTTPAAPDTVNSVGATDDASKGGLFNSLNNTTLNTLEQAIATRATAAATSATLKEDTDILLDLNVTVNDKDGSETVSQVRISGLTSIGEQNLTGILVDGNGNLVGSNDGSGTTILTSAEYDAASGGTTPIFFRPPRDFSGDVSLDIVAVVQEPTSGSTATSPTSTFNFTLAPVSETPEISLNDVSVVEFTDSSVDNVATYKTDLSNITVSLSDTSNLGEVKVVLSVAKDPDGLVDNETLGAAGNFSIDGILSSAASSDLNSTVNISSTSNNSSVTFTITGTDADGATQTETITGVNNNTVEGTKYFKTITQISSDAAANGINIGKSTSVVDILSIKKSDGTTKWLGLEENSIVVGYDTKENNLIYRIWTTNTSNTLKSYNFSSGNSNTNSNTECAIHILQRRSLPGNDIRRCGQRG